MENLFYLSIQENLKLTINGNWCLKYPSSIYTVIRKILSGNTYIFYLCVCTYVSICVLCSCEISSHLTILWDPHRCMPMNKYRGHGKVLCVCTKFFERQSFSCKDCVVCSIFWGNLSHSMINLPSCSLSSLTFHKGKGKELQLH